MIAVKTTDNKSIRLPSKRHLFLDYMSLNKQSDITLETQERFLQIERANVRFSVIDFPIPTMSSVCEASTTD